MDAKAFVSDSDPDFRIDDATGLTHFLDPYNGFFNDLTPEDAQPFIDHRGETYYLGKGPCISSENYRDLPMLYVQCERDQAMPLERQIGISKGMEVMRLDTGHDLFVSRPGYVAGMLCRVAWGVVEAS